jgi:hypothetical protein
VRDQEAANAAEIAFPTSCGSRQDQDQAGAARGI